MSDDFSFALPPFKADEALLKLKRDLRALRGLAERAEGFELAGARVIELALADGAIEARLAKRPARQSPEWERHTLRGAADVRRFLDETKKRVQRWTEDE